MTLAWDDPSDSAITGYEYQVNHNDTGTGNLTGWGEWTAIPGSGAGASSYDVDGLTNGSEYCFRLRAVNDVGPSESAPTGNPGYVSVLVGLAEAANHTEDDNLIEVSSLAQLNGQAPGRWDLDGNGVSGNTGYAIAFPHPLPGIGCQSTCTGYELRANLDFDTDGDDTAPAPDK